MTRRSGSSQRWRQRRDRDIYAGRASREGFRSRAAFKLEQIQAKERVLRAGALCIDLGASPGSWSQLAARVVGSSGRVWAVDLLPMEPIPNVEFIHGDFTAAATRAAVRDSLQGRQVDLVMSDMAPNISGNRAVDQPRSMALAEEALAFAEEALKPGGSLLIKIFQGEGSDGFARVLRRRFASVRVVKPKASRPESREIYLLARNYRMV
jgi:23S rRNA (uridine2552-2'-O)-methyltransferase